MLIPSLPRSWALNHSLKPSALSQPIPGHLQPFSASFSRFSPSVSVCQLSQPFRLPALSQLSLQSVVPSGSFSQLSLQTASVSCPSKQLQSVIQPVFSRFPSRQIFSQLSLTVPVSCPRQLQSVVPDSFSLSSLQTASASCSVGYLRALHSVVPADSPSQSVVPPDSFQSVVPASFPASRPSQLSVSSPRQLQPVVPPDSFSQLLSRLPSGTFIQFSPRTALHLSRPGQPSASRPRQRFSQLSLQAASVSCPFRQLQPVS